VLPDLVAYLAIHLRYDTTWYVMTERSLRIRRGIWIIHETTITFENVQNVTVNQGPIQRFFGIADVLVETAGGGSQHAEAHGGPTMAGHRGLVEGVSNAPEIRDLLMQHLRRSRFAGLGDELVHVPARPAAPAWTAEHLAALREIRGAAEALTASRG
jgi:PH (Pleckstrin Homology) domain-containing protein